MSCFPLFQIPLVQDTLIRDLYLKRNVVLDEQEEEEELAKGVEGMSAVGGGDIQDNKALPRRPKKNKTQCNVM